MSTRSAIFSHFGAPSQVSRTAAVVFIIAFSAGCAGTRTVPSADGDAGSGDDVIDSGVDAGWTQCSTPDGIVACAGPYNCPFVKDECGDCFVGDGAQVGICENWLASHPVGSELCDYCTDGDICVAWLGPKVFWCAPYNAGQLFAQNGASDLVRYADRGLWTDKPLPEPSICSDLGFPICGSNCGGCAAGICTGRSPLHPYGLCVEKFLPNGGGPNICGLGPVGGPPNPICPPAMGCFLYKVEPEAQDIADEIGFCLPLDVCQKAAANLPGGGKCLFQ